jgi:hypothetical protein
MRRASFVAAMAFIAQPLMAGSLDLCIENPARVDGATLESFQAELRAILTASGRTASFAPCRPGILTITLRRQPPDDEPSALGGTRYRDGRLVPEIELFVAPIAQIIWTRLPGVLGRALARVATHELGHSLFNRTGHAVSGVMMERLGAAHLMAADRGFFRLPPGD